MDNPYAIRTFFTLAEAASAIAGFVGWTRENRAVCQVIFDELLNSAQIGKLPVDKAPRFRLRQVESWGERHTVKEPDGTDWAKSRIARADLLAWCELNVKPLPALLFPEPPAVAGAVDTDNLSRYHTPALDALHAAIREFWLNHDPTHRPKSSEIVGWLMKEHGMTKAMAQAIDRVSRPESYRRGGNTKLP